MDDPNAVRRRARTQLILQVCLAVQGALATYNLTRGEYVSAVLSALMCAMLLRIAHDGR